MDPERWEKVREVFQAALEQNPGNLVELYETVCKPEEAAEYLSP